MQPNATIFIFSLMLHKRFEALETDKENTMGVY